MFISHEWSTNKLSKEAKGKHATKIVLMPSFWNHVVYTFKVMAPLVQVLHLIDGERRPAMGYIYEAMDKAKEAIMKSFNNNESKNKDVFAIIDDRWTCQLHRPLHAADFAKLQRKTIAPVGEMDGNDEDVGNELVFDDYETLNWEIVYEASGVGEPITYTRQRSRKRKEPASAATIAKTSKKGAEGEEEEVYASIEDKEIDYVDLRRRMKLLEL
ncbi:Ribonuclease H-like superfamily [Sesbania bispinosa]|nr:Ribonuclease H-like superfamily [Sesbania bispinosa]